MPPEEKTLTCENTARAMDGVPLFIKQRHVRACHNADPEYGSKLAEALGISLEEALVAKDPAHPKWDKRDLKQENTGTITSAVAVFHKMIATA